MDGGLGLDLGREREGTGGRNSDSGEASHGRRQRTRRRARIGGLGSAKRGTEGTRELGGRRGSCTGREDGRRGKPGRGRHGRRHGAHGARGLGAISHETRNETHGEREGTTASSPRAKIGGGDGSETAGRAEVRSAAVGASPCSGCGQERGENWSGGSRGARGGARLPFNEAEGHEGGAPTTPGR